MNRQTEDYVGTRKDQDPLPSLSASTSNSRCRSDSEIYVASRVGNISSTASHSHFSESQIRHGDACLREGPSGPVGSPVSVIGVDSIFSSTNAANTCFGEDRYTNAEDRLHPTSRKDKPRGVDSPKKCVNTCQVYKSTLAPSTSRSSIAVDILGQHRRKVSQSSSSVSTSFASRSTLDDLLDQLLAPNLEIEELVSPPRPLTPPNHKKKTVPKTSCPPLVPRPTQVTPAASAATKKEPQFTWHRRQNTSDSAKSAVAAVARGASKALQETRETADRPASRPRRQQTAGSDNFPDLESDDEIDVTNDGPPTISARPISKLTMGKVLGRIVRPRPPRHDSTSNDITRSIQLMKQSIKTKSKVAQGDLSGDLLTEADRPAARPLRQRTAECSSSSSSVSVLPVREIILSPASAVKVDDATADDTRDEASIYLEDNEKEDDHPDDVGLAHVLHSSFNPSAECISTWLNMPGEQRWSNSEPILITPQNLTAGQLPMAQPDDRENISDTLCRQTSYDESTTNDTACDDRMFQAWLKMPPRACTTHEEYVAPPALLTTDIPVARFSSQQATAEKLFSSCSSSSSCDLSMPLLENTGRSQAPLDDKEEGPAKDRAYTKSVVSIAKQAEADMRRRLVLPPPMPHRRLPSLLVDSFEIEEFEDNVINPLWSSMPAIASASLSLHCPPGLRSSWPSIRPRLDSEESANTQASAPSIPIRYRRQDSFLSDEAECDNILLTTAKPKSPSLSPTRRSLLPPTLPHRRKPSLCLDDMSKTSGDESAAYNRGRVESMWSSVPIFSSANLPPTPKTSITSTSTRRRRSSMEEPPMKPHRRKPSLNIEEGEEDGNIEIWLTHDHHLYGSSESIIHSMSTSAQHFCRASSLTANAGGSKTCWRQRRPQTSRSDSVNSIVLQEGEVEI